MISASTLAALLALTDDQAAVAEVIRLIEWDANLAGCDEAQGPLAAAVCNAIEAGDDPVETLRLVGAAMRNAAPAPPRYVRKLPSDWPIIRARIFERDGRECRYCQATAGPFHIDHIVPLRRGGSHADDNLCVACIDCNLSKKDSTLAEWEARR